MTKVTGRPKKVITKEQEDILFELAGGLSQEQIADYLGVSRSVFIERLKENEALSKQYKRGISTKYRAAVNKLWEHIDNGNVACLLFYIKTQMGWREIQELQREVGNTTVTLKVIGSDGNLITPSKDIITSEQK